MQYLELKEHFKDFIVFSLNDIKKVEPSFHRQRLNEWQKKGYIKKVINEYYIFSELEIYEPALFVIANTIYQPSYISLEMALSHHHLIPESVYSITSITSRTTRKFKSEVAHFAYRKMRQELLFGYILVSYKNHTFKIAEIEKAILDFFYLNPKIKTPADFEGLRFNGDVFKESVDEKRLREYLSLFGNKSLEKRAEDLIIFMKHA